MRNAPLAEKPGGTARSSATRRRAAVPSGATRDRPAPPEVVLHVGRRRGHPPYFLLRCQYCGHLFRHTRGPDIGRVLRDKGVPREVAMAFKMGLVRRLAEVAGRSHTDEELAAVMEATQSEQERRVLVLDRQSVVLDGVLYERTAS